jgi:hypothetical protein
MKANQSEFESVHGHQAIVDLRGAKLCLDCQAIFSGYRDCPRCASQAWEFLSKFVPFCSGWHRDMDCAGAGGFSLSSSPSVSAM